LYSSSLSPEVASASGAANKVTRPSTASSRARCRQAQCSSFVNLCLCCTSLILRRGFNP
jgi:hypothetical protein